MSYVPLGHAEPLDGEYIHKVLGGDGIFRVDGAPFARSTVERSKRHKVTRSLRCGTCSSVIIPGGKNFQWDDDPVSTYTCKKCNQVRKPTPMGKTAQLCPQFINNEIGFAKTPPKVHVNRTTEEDASTISLWSVVSPINSSPNFRTAPPDVLPVYAGALTWLGGRNVERFEVSQPPTEPQNFRTINISGNLSASLSQASAGATTKDLNTISSRSHSAGASTSVRTKYGAIKKESRIPPIEQRIVRSHHRVSDDYIKFLALDNPVREQKHSIDSANKLFFHSKHLHELGKKIVGFDNKMKRDDVPKLTSKNRPLYNTSGLSQDRPHYVNESKKFHRHLKM